MHPIGRLAAMAAVLALAATGPALAVAEFFPESSTDAIHPEDLDGLDCYTLGHARGEIYARHGYKFTNARDIAEFGAGTNASVELNPVEQSNVQLIEQYQNQNGCD